MKIRVLILLSITTLVLGACQGVPTAQSTAITQPSASLAATTTTPPAGLTLDQLMNAKIVTPQSQKTVQLKDGKYEGGGGADYVSITMLPQTVIAELNGDGKNDAAVMLAENDGGSGVFVSLSAFLATDGGFRQSAPVLTEDRAKLLNVTVADGKISLQAMIHGPQDSMATPSLQAVEVYQLYGNDLALTALSEYNTEVNRQILIDLPTAGEIVSGNIEVTGSMPAAPFENSLRYRFYDETGKVLNEGSFGVKSEDVGKPATFDNLLTLPDAADQTHLRLELADLSAEDGNPLSVMSVEIVVK